MTKIIIGTTPTITYKFKTISPAYITKAILTIKSMGECGQIILEKTLADAVVGERRFAVMDFNTTGDIEHWNTKCKNDAQLADQFGDKGRKCRDGNHGSD